MITYLNLASLLLGLASWIIAIVNILRYKTLERKKLTVYIAVSLSACAVSIFFQIAYAAHLVKINDFSALMDTVPSSLLASAVLLTVTIVLNATLIIIHNRSGQ